MRVTVAELREMQSSEQPTKSKYNNKRTEYNGRKYDSAKEAQYARDLDLAMHAKENRYCVAEWKPQVRFDLKVNGIHIAQYVLDFEVTYADGRVEYVDVKGYRKGVAYNVFKMKKRLMKAVHDIDIVEV